MSCPATSLRPLHRCLHTTLALRLPRRHPAPPPKEDYYSLLLSQPLASTAPTSFSPPSSPHPSSEATVSSKASLGQPKRDPSVIFGTPLAGPSAARRRAGYGESPSQGGLERPREPDNCCMSGCVNCVWDAYREEVEAWAERTKAAAAVNEEIKHREGMKAREMRGKGKRVVNGTRVADGSAGRATNLRGDEHLFDDVPVGIREFMATEKKLREKREARMERG
ncbi:MAG: hypothetical protein LQ351_004584 [Letrouitia transgressa]|nr:MAG: hypothetical protein LQ351_004584 [Letrouitia transgressa]